MESASAKSKSPERAPRGPRRPRRSQSSAVKIRSYHSAGENIQPAGLDSQGPSPEE